MRVGWAFVTEGSTKETCISQRAAIRVDWISKVHSGHDVLPQ